jgi:hypothetical protein
MTWNFGAQHAAAAEIVTRMSGGAIWPAILGPHPLRLSRDQVQKWRCRNAHNLAEGNGMSKV